MLFLVCYFTSRIFQELDKNALVLNHIFGQFANDQREFPLGVFPEKRILLVSIPNLFSISFCLEKRQLNQNFVVALQLQENNFFL